MSCLLLWSDNGTHHEMFLLCTINQTSILPACVTPSVLSSPLSSSPLLSSQTKSSTVVALGPLCVGVRLDHCSAVSLDCWAAAL